jgi:hypothetical protein
VKTKVGVDLRRAAVAVLDLDLFGRLVGGAQADGDVVGDVIAADGNDVGVPDRALLVEGQVGRAAADVGDEHAHLPLGRLQYRLGRGQGVEHRLFGADADVAGAVLVQVLQRRRGRGDDVGLYLQPVAVHAQRLAHPGVVVDGVVARDQVDDLPVVGDGDGLGRLQGAVDVGRGDAVVAAGARAAANGYHAFVVDGADVFPGDADHGLREPIAGRFLGRLHRAREGHRRRRYVDDHPFAHAARRLDAQAYDLELAVAHRAHQGTNLGCADVDSENNVLHGPLP